jgi:hypothetical protein
MRIEQRIGRVDRIGQGHPVFAFNLVMENSIDERVLQVLEEKLWRILAELGADKWGDVLETASPRVEDLYTRAITAPGSFEEQVSRVARETQDEVTAGEGLRELLTGQGAPQAGPRATEDWTAVAAAARERDAGRSLEPERLLTQLPEAAAGEALPVIRGEEAGIWSLWEVSAAGNPLARDCFALFVTDSGRLRPDLGERFWTRLATGSELAVGSSLDLETWEALHRRAEEHGFVPAGAAEGAVPWLVLRLVVRVRA